MSQAELDMTMMYAIHGAFRRDLDRLSVMTETPDPDRPYVTHGWETLKMALHGHHHSEDEDLWPLARRNIPNRPDDLAVLDAMEDEHATIDPMIQRIDAQLYRNDPDDHELADAVASFRDGLSTHLAHEESDALPVLNRAISEQEWAAFEQAQGKRYSLKETATLLPWITEEDSPASRRIQSEMPLPMRLLNQWVLSPRYRRSTRW